MICHTQLLQLGGNQIGDAGLAAFAKAVESGALAECTYISLGNNQIGDAGLTALASACASGALASLKKIIVDSEHERHPQLVAACQPRGIEIA